MIGNLRQNIIKYYLSALLLGLSTCMAPLVVQAEVTGQLQAAIWIDPDGCEHWVIDDGFEDYMPRRLTDEGKPVCRVGSVPYSTIDFERSLLGL